MAEHAQDFITNLPRLSEIARLHVFEYMATAMKLTNARATGEFGLDLATIPEVDEVDMEVLAVRIRSTRFDMGDIQTVLFGAPLTFTNQQIWDLSTIIVDHQREDWRVRAVTVMMATHARLGGPSRLSNLEPEAMITITNMALL